MARSRRPLLLFFSALAMTGLVACAGILSLDEFQKGECPGAKCGDGGDVPDGFTSEGGSDAGPDVKPDGTPGTEEVSWAKWRMPNYDAGTVFLPNQPLYNTDAGATADEVQDKVTGLTWRRKLISTPDLTLAQARAECAKLGPYRVPKRIELVTLLDYGRSADPFIDPDAFPSFPSVEVWTSSEYRQFDLAARPPVLKPISEYWTVNFQTGRVDHRAPDRPLRALCVKAK